MYDVRESLGTKWREILGYVLVVLGAIAALIGWIGVSGEEIEALQLPYLASGGIGGLILTATGAALLVSSDVRADRARLGRLEAEILELQDLVRELSHERAEPAPRAGPPPRRARA